MLQQTQAGRVAPRWVEFMARWPTPAACAEAAASEVVTAWAGLGYNRRALNLHRCAVEVTARHAGRVPTTLAELTALPGIGPYTARAVLAFAAGADVGVVDTNARRVLLRAGAGRRLGGAELQRFADELVPAGRGWEWNQAVLDLGATVCTARAPRCDRCPLQRVCAWSAAGGAGGGVADPAAGSRRQPRFEGSDRQARGRLLDALRAGPVSDVAGACGWPGDAPRAVGIAGALVADGFAVWSEKGLALR